MYEFFGGVRLDDLDSYASDERIEKLEILSSIC